MLRSPPAGGRRPAATGFGIEIGGTWMRAVIVDGESRKLLDSERLPTPDAPDLAVDALRNLWVSLGRPPCFGFASAAETTDGVVTRWPSRPAFVGCNLLAAFASSQPVCLDDGSAAAYAEHNRSAQADGGSSVYITVGTGVGGGAVLAGRLWRGARGAAMDIGHMLVPAAATRRCQCGSLGCVQAIASANALRAADGTVAARRVSEAAQGLGELTLQLARVFDSALFIVGGGALEAVPELFDSIRHSARALGVTADIAHGVLGTFAGCIGAAEFARAVQRH